MNRTKWTKFDSRVRRKNCQIVNVVSGRIRASFLSISQLAWQIGFAPAAAVSGFLWNDDYSKAVPFYIASALYVIASVIFWAYFRNIKDPGNLPKMIKPKLALDGIDKT